MSADLPSSSQLLQEIRKHQAETITLEELIKGFREGGFSLLLIVFAAPLALPVPAIGFAQVMALPILLLTLQLAVGKHSPWVPSRWGQKKIEMASLRKVIDKIMPYLEKLERFLKPRIRLFSTRVGDQLVGLACIICAVSVALPIPFSNTVPSAGILLMSIGLLERDGFVIMAGMCIGAIGVMLSGTVIYFGAEAVSAVLS